MGRQGAGVKTSLIRDEHDRKRCTKCLVWQDVSQFNLNNSTTDLLECSCKTCVKAVNGVTNLARMGFDRRGIEAVAAVQGDRCAICRGEVPTWHIDHDHRCCPPQKSCAACFRGLLCRKCNHLLGNARDSVDILRNAIKYLEQWDAR